MTPAPLFGELDLHQIVSLLILASGLGLLVVLWIERWRGGPVGRRKGLAFLTLGVVPAFYFYFGTEDVLERSKRVDSCVSCHLMVPYGKDLRRPGSVYLAARHFQNNRLGPHACYACHSRYGIFGGVQAKLAGARHLWLYTTGRYTLPIRSTSKTPEQNCVRCHLGTPVFSGVESHQDVLQSLRSGEASCFDCHERPHPPFTEKDWEAGR